MNRNQTSNEEVANAITHGVGVALSIACLCVAVVFAALRKDVWSVVSVSIYGACMFTLYLCSTLYHAIGKPRTKAVLNILDHAAIYLLIAGSYTPFCLAGIRNYSPGWAWSIFGVVWGLAIVGIVFQSLFVNRFQRLSNATYLAMGWIVLIAVYPLWKAMGTAAVLWIGAGGVAYSLGVIFYAMKQIRYMHAIWHIFVLAGTLIHYGVVLFYIALGR
ncbi:MAG: hemolysin III family protein [Bacteroidales bacterium]|nr:hemolysin III family protein [Bacteroidales bacterium]